jgi:hypothetical protein
MIVQGKDATDSYLWGDHELAFHRCKECGCVMYMEAVNEKPPFIYGINARMNCAPSSTCPGITPMMVSGNVGHSIRWLSALMTRQSRT